MRPMRQMKVYDATSQYLMLSNKFESRIQNKNKNKKKNKKRPGNDSSA